MDLITLDSTQLKKLHQNELSLLKEVDRLCTKHHIKYTLAYGTLLGAVREHGFIPWDDDVDICMLREDFERFKQLCRTELNIRFFYQTNESDPEYYHLFDKIRINNTVFKETYLSTYNINHGVFIDIFPLDTIPDNVILRKMQYILFHFFRCGLMIKYLNIDARKGKKKLLARILRIIYSPFSKKQLYNKAIKIAKKYNNSNYKHIHNFFNSIGLNDTFEKKLFLDICRVDFENIKLPIPVKYDIVLKKIYGNYMERPPLEDRKTTHEIIDFEL